VNRFLQLFRVGNCVMGVVGLLLGALVASGADILDHWEEVALASIVVFTFVAAGNALNDYTDREVDRKAHPTRPLPSGRIEPRRALQLSALLFVLSLLFSLPLDWISLTIVVGAMAIMLLYESRSKREGLAGNLSISLLTGALFLLGGSVVGAIERTAVIAAMAALATLGREVIKDIEDMDADFDRRTLPQRIGAFGAGALASLAFLVAVGLSLQPYLAGDLGLAYLLPVVVADAIFIYCSGVHFRNPRRGQRTAKLGMLVALLAFLLGGFQVTLNGGIA